MSAYCLCEGEKVLCQNINNLDEFMDYKNNYSCFNSIYLEENGHIVAHIIEGTLHCF